MSKLEVREITPISGETDLTLGQSGGTVTLASGATAVGFGGTNTPSFSVRQTGSLSMPADANKKLTFDDVIFDTGSGYDTVTNRYTVPTGEGGKYLIGLSVTLVSTSKLYGTAAHIHKNGGGVSSSKITLGTGSTSTRTTIYDSRVLELSAGDYLEVYGYIWGPGTLTFEDHNSFFGFKLVE